MGLPPSTVCPRCGVPRVDGPECPRCGVIYARARRAPLALERPAARGAEEEAGAVGDARGVLPGADPAVWRGDLDDARRELLARAVGPPAALLVAWALVSTGAGHGLVRIFTSMWVHEIGHAAAAWWSGYGAFPGPWRTPVSSSRMPVVVLALAAALAVLAWRGWRARRPLWIALGAAGLLLQVACTIASPTSARALITFGGDAGCMVLGSALIATLWTDPEGPLGKGWLRWGFLAMGACALVDALHTWVRSSLDHRLLPLGEIEGVGLSDASRLMQVHGWSVGELTGRYVTLGVACLAALAAGYAVALARARTRAREAEGMAAR